MKITTDTSEPKIDGMRLLCQTCVSEGNAWPEGHSLEAILVIDKGMKPRLQVWCMHCEGNVIMVDIDGGGQ